MNNPARFRAACDDNPTAALGRAVAYLMTKPNFENRQFGPWSKILTGQINRKHYFFVVESKTIVGFAGWALTNKVKALAWLNDNAPLSYEDSLSGDSMIINAWAADNESVNRFILKTLRHIAVGKNVYAKRFYSDGSIRLVKLSHNQFIQAHIDADAR